MKIIKLFCSVSILRFARMFSRKRRYNEIGAFVTTWSIKEEDRRVKIVTNDQYIYHYDLSWVNIEDDALCGRQTNLTGDLELTLPKAGRYRIAISGIFPHFILDGSSSSEERLLSVEQWGNIVWRSMKSTFYGAANMIYNAVDKPNLEFVESLSEMFYGASSFNGDLNNWDVTKITDMSYTFCKASAFNGDLSGWDVSSVQDMWAMFAGASVFQGDLSSWDVSKVLYMEEMFKDAYLFNSNISGWDVAKVVDMTQMFLNAHAFDVDISRWDISRVEYMDNMLDYSGLSVVNYDAMLRGWAMRQQLKSAVVLGAKNLIYNTSASFREKLTVTHKWQITDDYRQSPSAD